MAIHMEMTPIRGSSWNVQDQDQDQPQEQEQQQQQQPTNKIPRQRNRRLSLSEATCDMAWERQRRQSLRDGRKKNGNNMHINHSSNCLTDEDMKELKGCIELGFGFNEEKLAENGPKHRLRHTLPALDLYFAVNRQSFSRSPIMSPTENRENNLVEGCGDDDQWKLCNAGDSPQEVKTKLRHWAQAVACSVRQTSC
ncbi:uncharacterized protein LOC124917611 [Impatiens glandulifera]|uniref:uncharacterized protein LOC124917611 n=1 Tax=Impatiens glandulifera TaxID=253017 RepID=UPI001FB0D0A4|nr:uncharacterized protein LOC124917611 [Impatiens glandulifera]